MVKAPQSEWMLWAKRLKDELVAVQDQVRALENECAELRKLKADVSQVKARETNEGSEDTTSNIRDQPRLPCSNCGAAAISLQPERETSTLEWVEPQGSRSLEQYFDLVQVQHAQSEEAQVLSFLTGMRPSPERASLEADLRAAGYTWPNLCAHVENLIRTSSPPTRRRLTRRSLI